MRYCVFSDVHGNLEAFEAVLASFAEERINEYFFLGDAVGYGADPYACITELMLLKPQVLIAGNHEFGVLELLDIKDFNEYAGVAIEWTKNRLRGQGLDYLESFSLSSEYKNFTLVHGSLDEPEKFNYILDNDAAGVSLELSNTQLCFVGHTHEPGAYFMKNREVVFTEGPKIPIEAFKKYIINAGSVGQPRDGDPRASYVIYDDFDYTVEIKRVSYDIATAQKKILKAGLPACLAERLAEGR